MNMAFFTLYGLVAIFCLSTALSHTFNMIYHIINFTIARKTENPQHINQDVFISAAAWWASFVMFAVLFFKFGW